MQIKNATLVITGAASGMGAATAKHLARLGAHVALLDLNESGLATVAKETAGKAFLCDVTQEEPLEHILTQIKEQLGPIQGCVNCAGIIHSRRMINKEGAMPLAEFRKVIEINLLGTFNVMRLVAKAMMDTPIKDEERGVIINTASIAAFEGQIGQTAYSASKGAIVGLTLPAARELASMAIRVVGIAPGLVDTPMFDKISPDAKAALASAVPFPKRLARAEEFAMLVQHIFENPMLNGTVIRLDGALRMPPK